MPRWMCASLLFLVWLPLAAAKEAAKPIGPAEAAKKVGEVVTLKMEVQSAVLRGDVGFLNSEIDYQDPKNFLVFLAKASVEKFREAKIEDAAEHFRGKTIEVHGKIELYHNRAQIIITAPEQIKIVQAKSTRAGLTAETTPAMAAPSKLVAVSHGAAGRVSGSFHELDTGNARWLIDCGVIFDEETVPGRMVDAATVRSPTEFPSTALAAKALFITHAHADHLGRVPLLVHNGFSAPIYATSATKTLAEVVFESGIRYESSYPRHWTWSKRAKHAAQESRKAFAVHWRDCRGKQAIAAADRDETDATTQQIQDRFHDQKPRVKISLCQDCVREELATLMRPFHTLPYDTPVEVGPGVKATFLNAGHIPGSASVLLEVEVGGRTRRVLYSGDLGNDLSPLFPGPKPAPNVDAVFTETTYGAANRGPEVARQQAEFRKALGDVAGRGGVVWIPAFALDRTQKVLYEIHLAQKEKLLPESLAIYCSSPTARAITDVYREHQKDGWFSAEVAGDRDAWSPRTVRAMVPSYSSLPRPCIVLSTTDLSRIPWMARLAADLLADKSNACFTVGYSDPESAQGRLKLGAEELIINGREVRVRAATRSFACFTGHGSADDIDRWLNPISRQATVVLIHGDPRSLKERAEQLRGRGWTRVVVAEAEQSIDLLGR